MAGSLSPFRNMNNNTNGTTGSPNVAQETADTTVLTLWQQYNQLKSQELAKNNLIEELLYRYEYLSTRHKQECEDHEREREYNRMVQREKKSIQEQCRMLEKWLSRDPFLLVLIDGDGMIFTDALLSVGEAGGRQAAGTLQRAVLEYAQEIVPQLPDDIKVVTRIYANVKGLADVCTKAGVVDRPQKVEEFAKGFTQGRTLFDFIDVGPGKDRADKKIAGLFKLHLHDYHCRQIFFGCSHDNGYARLLEEVVVEEGARERVTLLEGVPFEKELLVLPFRMKKLEGLFRHSKINLCGVTVPAAGSTLRPAVPTTPSPAQNIAQQVRKDSSGSWTEVTYHKTNGHTPSSQVTTWANAASKAANAPESPSPAIVNPVSVAREAIPRNRKGQRVDPICRNYDKEEVTRVKKLKMCNVHFLRSECTYGDECTHVHRYKPSAAEIATLRLVARMAPCQHGSECDDPKCIYGHRCPAPEAKHPSKGKKNCIFGEACRFPDDMHSMDTVAVKQTKITGTF